MLHATSTSEETLLRPVTLCAHFRASTWEAVLTQFNLSVPQIKYCITGTGFYLRLVMILLLSLLVPWPSFSAANLENHFSCLESFLFSSLGILLWPWERGPAKCIVSVALSIRAASSCPTHHMRDIDVDSGGSAAALWSVQNQPAWGGCDFWFHSDTIPDWALLEQAFT